MTCDNTGGIVDATCTYSKTIGTSFEDEVENSMGIDGTIEAEMKAQFFGIFGIQLGVSSTTGYNWNEISTAAQSEVESYEVGYL
jgi:curli biogenesis system outer membrane secretion channel CsgG